MPNLFPEFELNYEYLNGLHLEREYEIYKPQLLSGRKHENI